MERCAACNRAMKSPTGTKDGLPYGPVCWRRYAVKRLPSKVLANEQAGLFDDEQCYFTQAGELLRKPDKVA